MAKTQSKPFSKTELKILVFNKVKRGMRYEDAVKQVKEEISLCNKTHYQNMKKEKENKPAKFKEEFDKLKNG